MKILAQRKLAIATTLCSLGVLGYLLLSNGPARVQIITIPEHLLLLLLISLVFWWPGISLSKRCLAVLGIVVFLSVVFTFVDSLVVRALFPLHPTYFVLGFLALLIETFAFLGLTWLIDRGLPSR